MGDRTLRQEVKAGKPIPPEAEAFLNILRTAERVTDEITRFLKPYSLTRQQYNVLRILRGSGPDGLPCLEIADRMITRVPDVTRLIDRMVKADLVLRRRCDEDRRVVRVRINARGRRLVDRLDEPMAQLHRDQLGHLTRAELKQLMQLLVKVRSR